MCGRWVRLGTVTEVQSSPILEGLKKKKIPENNNLSIIFRNRKKKGPKKKRKKRRRGWRRRKERNSCLWGAASRVRGVRGLGSAIFLCKPCTVTFPTR